MHVGRSNCASRIINLGFAADMQFFRLGNWVGMYSISEMMHDLQGSYKNDGVENCVAGKATELGR
jgi:hypothetical protein